MNRIFKNEISSRFGDFERNQLYAESTILDPRFKRKGFKNQSSYENAVKIIRNRIGLIRLPNSTETTEVPSSEQSESNEEELNIWNDYD